MATFALGGTRYKRIEVEVLRYERAATGEYWDDNWLVTRIAVNAGAFRGAFEAALQAADLTEFRDQLIPLNTSASGVAAFKTMEEQLELLIAGNGRGGVYLEGVATDEAGIGNRLNFHFSLDLPSVAETIAQLELVIAQFPVRST
jgi:hypothetical protein